jgi:hypothetical protein
MPGRPPSGPPSRAEVWKQFLLWVLGVPLVVVAGCGVIAGALWVSGGDMVWQAISGIGTALVWLGLIVLIYPVMVFVWVADLRAGLRAAGEWAGMDEAARAQALAAQAETEKRRGRR